MAIHLQAGAYTTLKPIFRGPYDARGSDTWGISAFLAILEVLTLEFTYLFARRALSNYLGAELFSWVALLISIVSNISIAIYVPIFNNDFNVGVFEGNEWHNSTYLAMKLVAVLVMMLYFRVDEKYQKEGISFLEWLGFASLLVLVNAIKPNFMMTFGPTVLVVFVKDLIESKGKSFFKIVAFGTAVLPSLAVVLYQYLVLFSSVDSSNNIAIGLGVVWQLSTPSRSLSFMRSMAFPLLALAAFHWDIHCDRAFRFSWIMFFVAFMEYFFLYEDGDRILHGNFDWGLSFAVYLLLLLSCIQIVKLLSGHSPLLSAQHNSKRVISGAKVTIAQVIVARVSLLALAAHTISGIIYYVLLLLGRSYR